ncbi:hypothetical protein [uncultured Formosa sp.]|uniref:hypothetical protein n=1 Tax=uncultured Formosa sp. TaxID=255435 RepID=UPI00260F1675|nr:hypothetical protein [uncultured Formosa sp.]
MNKLVPILILIFAVFKIAYSFWNNAATGRFLTMDLDIWIYRLVWMLIIAGSAYVFYKSEKNKT